MERKYVKIKTLSLFKEMFVNQKLIYKSAALIVVGGGVLF